MFRPLGGQGQSDCVQTSVRRCWDTTACTHQAQHGVIKCSDRESYLAPFAFSVTFIVFGLLFVQLIIFLLDEQEK